MNVLQSTIAAGDVLNVLKKHMLVDGFDFILDLEKSKGLHLVDAVTGDTILDFFSFVASQALGMNHPKLTTPEFIEHLGKAAVNKPSNSDVYCQLMAEFVDTFSRIAMPESFKYLFFVEGGSVANENGIKTAIDWKIQKNFAKGYKQERGTQIIHFKEAFHGRTGYSLMLTNTDPVKSKWFPRFDWPRITNPKVTFPLEENLDAVIKAEQQAVDEILRALKENPDDIAMLIIEPIQGEGGDNFFRKEFLLKLRELADEHEFLLMFDEVQCGMGMTGKMWAAEHYVMPDILSFGKKSQVCGIMVSGRIDDVEHHCFNTSSRINSTWGGNLVDMVRATKILQIIEEDNLVEHARVMGEYMLERMKELQTEFPQFISNARALGLWGGMDMPSPEIRKVFLSECYKNKLAILGSGTRTVRFRPALTVTKEDLDQGFEIMKKVLFLM